MTRFRLLGFLTISATLAACGNPAAIPSAPSSLASPLAIQAPPGALLSASSTHAQPLTAVLGVGSGTVSVTPTAGIDGSFSAQITVNVHSAPPNTTFYVQRAPEVGRPNNADGICQRAAGEAPWGDVPNFVPFILPPDEQPVVLQTSEGGAGSVHFDFAALTIADGTVFDVLFRLVDNPTTNELRTDCFTVSVK